jgi:hypothetical protein
MSQGHQKKAHAMRTFAIVPLVAAAVALTLTPALAKTKAQPRAEQSYQQPYGYGPAPYQQWTGSDPSRFYNPNFLRDQQLGRCVEDLGYGRYEYCD